MTIPKIIFAAVLTCIFFSLRAQNVGIGTTTPESKLQVAGKITADSLKIVGGAGNGKVLTSDSSGNAKWISSANIARVNNGIVIDTGTIQLGGALTKKTSIDIGDHRFKIGKTGPLLSEQLINNISSTAFQTSVANHWQSFTCPQDAVLDSIQIIVRTIATSNARAYLYEGEGISGTLLATSDLFSYPVYLNHTTITVLRTTQPLEAEKIYSIYITNIGGWEIDFAGFYPYGVSSLGFGDFNFSVYGTYHQDNGLILKSTGEPTIEGNASISGNGMLEFGGGIFPKEANAGKIGYQSFSPDALDIIGAGTSGTNRKITFWNEGGATFVGPITTTNLSLSGSIVQQPVNPAALQNGWIPFGSGYASPGFWKDKEGIVHLQGLARNINPVPINGVILFTLPAGYRPSGGRLMFSINNNNGVGRIDIASDGDVTIEYITSNAWINLTGVSFRTN
jgi:hypothetical protein